MSQRFAVGTLRRQPIAAERSRVVDPAMSEYADISGEARVALVKALGEEDRVLYVELDNGATATIRSNDGPFTLTEGDVVLVWPGESRFEPAPRSLWPHERKVRAVDDQRVAVVRLRRDDITVVDEGGRWRHIATKSEVEYAEGNTVLIDGAGVVRVLADKPLRLLDTSPLDQIELKHFRVPKTATDSFEDFGGMIDVITRAKELIELPLSKAQQLREIGARPIKGVLFTGPPGTGKTLLARIIASRSEATFYKVSGPEVVSKWYGESEAILRRIFEDAAQQTSAIIFFDEIDGVAGRRSGDSHESSRRFVAQLLALMDGFRATDNVVVIAATNRPDSLDPALRRPGRFDWEIAFTLPNELDRAVILKTSARHLKAEADLPHGTIAKLTDGWSGAELAAIWSEAALLAAADARACILEEDYVEGHRRVARQREQKEKEK